MAKKESKPNPLIGKVTISTGPVSTPYRVAKGNRMLLGGTANLELVKKYLKNQKLSPIETKEGKALMTIWVSNFEEADLSAHVELKIGFLVSRTALKALKPHPLGILKLLSSEPKVAIYNFQTWNDIDSAVAYNKEHLGLNAVICDGVVQRDENKEIKKFVFSEFKTGEIIFEGQVSEMPKTLSSINWQLVRLMGFKEAFKFISKFWLKTRSINPIGEKIQDNQVAETFTSSEKSILHLFDDKTDSIKFAKIINPALDFQPQFFQHMNDIKFVYLDPKEWITEKRKGRFSRKGFGRRPLI